MAIKRYKPTSSARRFMTVSAFDEITAKKPDHFSKIKERVVVETLKVKLLFAILVVVTEENIVSSTSRE